MSQTGSLLDALKRQLRAQGKTYADVAQWLGLSEASVKRMFAERHVTLARLECMCERLDIEFAELVHAMQADERRLQELTQAQEQSIADDHELFLVAVCVLNGYSFADIHRQYQLSEAECTPIEARAAGADRASARQPDPAAGSPQFPLAPRWAHTAVLPTVYCQRVLSLAL